MLLTLDASVAYSKTFPSCTKTHRHSLRPNIRRVELERLKQYISYQKQLLQHVIRRQRVLSLEYSRRTKRYNYQLWIDRQAFETFGISPMRSHPHPLIIDTRRLNQIFDQIDKCPFDWALTQHDIKHCRLCTPLIQRKQSVNSSKSTINNHVPTKSSLIIPTTSNETKTCSRLIAQSYVNEQITHSSSDVHRLPSNQSNSFMFNREISLTKVFRKRYNRSLLSRTIHENRSTIHSLNNTNP
jgi:hypothetical protein